MRPRTNRNEMRIRNAKGKLLKWYRYRVTKITGAGRKRTVKVGHILLYRRGHGARHFELIFNFKTGKMSQIWHMEWVGPCWTRGRKIVQTEDTVHPRIAKQLRAKR